MPLIYLRWITREMVRALPEQRFVFGDNLQRVGMGGQAAAMRGEPNAIGIVTKRAPGMAPGDFFSDGCASDRHAMFADLGQVREALKEGRVVKVPRDGLGTGLSELPKRAPVLYGALWTIFDHWSPEGCPWPAS